MAANIMESDGDRGLYEKYIVIKKDGTEIKSQVFVLSPEVDDAALLALATYAGTTENKHLAQDLRSWIQTILKNKQRILERGQ